MNMQIDNLITILSIIGLASTTFYAMFRVSKYAFLLNITILAFFVFCTSEGNELVFSLGQIEAQKVSIYSSIKIVQEKQLKLGKELQEKYGDGNIDLESGEFTKPE